MDIMRPVNFRKIPTHPYPPTIVYMFFELPSRNEGLFKNMYGIHEILQNSFPHSCKEKTILISLQNPAQPMGWLGWSVAMALKYLYYVEGVPQKSGKDKKNGS